MSGPEYVRRETAGWSWRVARGGEDALVALAAALPGAEVVKEYRHKKTVVSRVGGRTYLVKIYKAGSWFRRVKGALLGSRADHELEMSRGVVRRGIPTSPVFAVGRRKGESCAVFEALDGWVQLQEVLLDPATDARRRMRLLFEYGRFARRLHDAGVWQYDFNPTNILVRGSEFKVIDFERMKLARSLAEAARLRSIAKMDRIPRLSRSDRLRFIKGYVAGHPEDQRRLGEIVAAVRRFADRKRADDVRRQGRRCVSENRDFGPFRFGPARGYYRKRRPEDPGVGLTADDVRALCEGAGPSGVYRLEPVARPIDAWKEANRRARAGGPLPLAVVIDGRGGRLCFREGRAPDGTT